MKPYHHILSFYSQNTGALCSIVHFFSLEFNSFINAFENKRKVIGSFSYDGIIINYNTVLQENQKNRRHDLIRFNKKPQIGFPNCCSNFKSQTIHIISKSNDLPSCVMSL